MQHFWWGWKGLNLRPTGYEPAALTTELQPLQKYYNDATDRSQGGQTAGMIITDMIY